MLNWSKVAALSLLPLCAVPAAAQWIPDNPVQSVAKQPDGVLFTMHTGTLKLQVCTDSIVHIVYAPAGLPKRHDYVITKAEWPPVSWNMDSDANAVTLSTDRLKITVARKDGSIVYAAGAK